MKVEWIEKAGDFISREIDGEVIIISPDGRRMHMLNETAGLVWSCIDERKSIEHIAAVMCREYAVPPDKAHNDILAVVGEMADNKLVRIGVNDNP